MKNRFGQGAVKPPKYMVFPTDLSAAINQALGAGAPHMVWLRDGGPLFKLREIV